MEALVEGVVEALGEALAEAEVAAVEAVGHDHYNMQVCNLERKQVNMVRDNEALVEGEVVVVETYALEKSHHSTVESNLAHKLVNILETWHKGALEVVEVEVEVGDEM